MAAGKSRAFCFPLDNATGRATNSTGPGTTICATLQVPLGSSPKHIMGGEWHGYDVGGKGTYCRCWLVLNWMLQQNLGLAGAIARLHLPSAPSRPIASLFCTGYAGGL
jgi:hypothetical protein